jgi:hypothetical protein
MEGALANADEGIFFDFRRPGVDGVGKNDMRDELIVEYQQERKYTTSNMKALGGTVQFTAQWSHGKTYADSSAILSSDEIGILTIKRKVQTLCLSREASAL